jgi:CRISPR-associated endonuclease/helicase Cas3
MAPDMELLSRLIAAAGSGAQVAVICNLVDVAQTLYEKLRAETDGLPIEIELFHARFRFLDRQGKEKGVIRNFGFGGDRSSGRILVATQVVEQSLDVDFDWIVTQLCPVDLLFQRMGRLHRHEKNDGNRPVDFAERLCTVLLPNNDDFGGTGVVYANNRVLWRTEQMLTTIEIVEFPTAYREWIERVYQELPWGNEPEEVTEVYRKFRDEVEEIKGFMAQQVVNMAKDANPFCDSNENITAVTRDGEMGLTVMPYLFSANGRQTIDGDLLDHLDEYQRDETLALNCVSVPGSRAWKYSLNEIELDKEGRYWLEMQPDGEGFVAEGKKVIFRYHRDTGLRREQK